MLGCFTPDILVNLHKKLHLFCQFYRWVAWGSKRLSDLPKISEWLDVWVWTFGQDGGVGRHTVSSHNQNKDNNKFKNKKQPELTETQTIWKSDNQGVKEETFIQTGRRGRGRQAGWRGLITRQRLADWVAPHSCAEKPGGTTGERDRPHNPGLQCLGIKLQTSDWKYLWGLRQQWEKLPASQSSLERQGPRMYTNPPTWGVSTRRAQFDCG